MNPWLFPWQRIFKGPLSGNVTQDISPDISWLSPQVEFNFAGDRRIEAKVVADVASYGKQLGILSEAMLEIADGNKAEAVERLRKLTNQINEVKLQHEEIPEQKVKSTLNQMKLQDPEALKRLLSEYR